MSRMMTFSYDITLNFDNPVTDHCFVLRCLPTDSPEQQVLDAALTLDPPVTFSHQQDSFGNRLQIGRIDGAHDHFHYRAEGTVLRDGTAFIFEPDRPLFRYPSAFTAPSPALQAKAKELALPCNLRDKAWAILEAVQTHMRYVPGVTDVHTTAAQAFELGQGVC